MTQRSSESRNFWHWHLSIGVIVFRMAAASARSPDRGCPCSIHCRGLVIFAAWRNGIRSISSIGSSCTQCRGSSCAIFGTYKSASAESTNRRYWGVSLGRTETRNINFLLLIWNTRSCYSKVAQSQSMESLTLNPCTAPLVDTLEVPLYLASIFPSIFD